MKIKLTDSLEQNVTQINDLMRIVLGHQANINDWTPGWGWAGEYPQVVYRCKTCQSRGSFVLARSLFYTARTHVSSIHWNLSYVKSWPECKNDEDLDAFNVFNLKEGDERDVSDVVKDAESFMCTRFLAML